MGEKIKNALKGLYVIFFCLGISCATVHGQDAMFSQYFASGQYFNPSLVATESSITIAGITRTQWKAVDAAYQTSMLGLTFPIKDRFEKHKRLAGVNVSLIDDKSADGVVSNLGVNLTVAYGLALSEKNTVFLGIMGGYYQRRLNTNNFQWGQQYNASLGWDSNISAVTGAVNENVNYFDLNVGALFVHDLEKKVGTDRSEIYLGFSASHLTSPSTSFIARGENEGENLLPIKLNFNGGVILPMGEKIGISPNVLYEIQGDLSQLNVGVYGTYYLSNRAEYGFLPNAIELGIWHRLNDSYMCNIGFGNELYHLGFSVDLTSSNLNYSSGVNNAYEISFKACLPHKKTERHYTPRF